VDEELLDNDVTVESDGEFKGDCDKWLNEMCSIFSDTADTGSAGKLHDLLLSTAVLLMSSLTPTLLEWL
jgi:hypothetical protein